MNEQDFIKRVLDQDLTGQSLPRDPDCAESASSDPDKQAALEQIDLIRQLMGHEDEADVPGEPTCGWDRFESRLAALATARPDERQQPMPHPLKFTAWLGWIAAAACIGLAALAWSGRVDPTQPTTESATGTPTRIAMVPTAVELREHVGVFGEINSAFDNRAHWISTVNGDADMGLGEPNSGTGRLIVARLTLQMADSSGPPSQVDLVILSGQQAVVTVPIGAGLQVAYRIDTRIKGTDQDIDFELWAEFHTPGDRREMRGVLATSTTYKAGRVHGVGRVVIDGQTYILGLGFGGDEQNEPTPPRGATPHGGAV